MKHIILFALFLAGSLSAQDNINFDLISNFPLPETGNDVWGYVDTDLLEDYGIKIPKELKNLDAK